LTLNQRDLTSFDESVIYGNMMNTDVEHAQCINCHSYQNYNPRRMQFHVREDRAGTVIAYDGTLVKANLKTDSLISGGVYPAWHPTEKLIAYSVNQTGQTFHTRDLQKVEVQDMLSDLILYDVEKNEVTRIPGDADELEVFPWWSPDGKYLYYASARFVRKDTAENLDNETILRYKEIKYNLFRRSFDPASRRIGPPELVFDAAARGKSATLPRISPDGHYITGNVYVGGKYLGYVWKDGKIYRQLKENNGIAIPYAISPDGEYTTGWVMNKFMPMSVKEAILLHHEKCDGTGYPFGLKSDKIPETAKIIAIADVYDAMTSSRIYRAPICPFEVVRLMYEDAFTKFDPVFAIPFLKNVASSYIHTDVRLSDGRVGKVILINDSALHKPVVQVDGEYIDLSKKKDLNITALL
jgi:hypothetical protein